MAEPLSRRLLAGIVRLDRTLARWVPQRWWLWPTALLLLGAGAVTAAVLVSPGPYPETLTLFGEPFGSRCEFYVRTGLPCATCGMTRSWVWLVRGHIWRAFVYSPAGATLLAWLAVGGVLGGLRLVTRRARLLAVDHRVLGAWVLFWLVVLHGGHWAARLLGFNPLPPP